MEPLFKKIILGFLILLTLNVSAQGPLRHVKTDIFELWYSEQYLEPTQVHYSVLCNSKTHFSRAGLNFYSNDSIRTTTDSYYKNNDYDKGHMAPAADFNCNENWLKETFSYLNCTLQNQYLNRGVWKELEDYERELAMTSTVYVEIEIEFKGATKVKDALVPSGFFKTLYRNGKPYQKYYFPNVKPTKDWQSYLIQTF
jgi:endonuclease G